MLLLMAGASASAACSSSSGAPAVASPPVAQAPVCPITTTDTVGKPCAAEGLRCAPQYTCDEAPLTLSCVCTAGVFRCNDGTGSPVDEASDGGGPCPSSTTIPPSVCPPSEGAANGAACNSPGQICPYRSICAGMIDQCVCFPTQTSTGGYATLYTCNRAICADDASAPPPPVDAGADAPAAVDAPEDAPVIDEAGLETGADATPADSAAGN
jgi:hypothetical protein